MERSLRPLRLRLAALPRRLAIAAVTALALAFLAGAAMAATSRGTTPLSSNGNGCPNQTSGARPIARLTPPQRLQIVSFKLMSEPINAQTQSFRLRVRVGSTCDVDIRGASVYVTAVPYNQFDIPEERLTGSNGTVQTVLTRLSGFPASSKQQQLTLFIRATKPGEPNGKLAGVSTRRLVAIPFSS